MRTPEQDLFCKEMDVELIKLPAYIPLPKPYQFYCLSHRRDATHLLLRRGMCPSYNCDPKKGGILLPCECVDKPLF